MADISLKGLLMDKGEAVAGWTRQLMRQNDALEKMMREVIRQAKDEPFQSQCLTLTFTKRNTRKPYTVFGHPVDYRPDLAWRLTAQGERWSGLTRWHEIEPVFPPDYGTKKSDKIYRLTDRMERASPGAIKRVKLYESMRQRLRREAMILHDLLPRMKEFEPASEWIIEEGLGAPTREELLEVMKRCRADNFFL